MKIFVTHAAKQVHKWFFPDSNKVSGAVELASERLKDLQHMVLQDNTSHRQYKLAMEIIDGDFLKRFRFKITRKELMEYNVLAQAPFQGRRLYSTGFHDLGNCPRCLCVLEMGCVCPICDEQSHIVNSVTFVVEIKTDDKQDALAYWNPFFVAALLSLEDELHVEGLKPDDDYETIASQKKLRDCFDNRLWRNEPYYEEFAASMIYLYDYINQPIVEWEDDTMVSGEVALALKNLIEDPSMKTFLKRAFPKKEVAAEVTISNDGWQKSAGREDSPTPNKKPKTS